MNAATFWPVVRACRDTIKPPRPVRVSLRYTHANNPFAALVRGLRFAVLRSRPGTVASSQVRATPADQEFAQLHSLLAWFAVFAFQQVVSDAVANPLAAQSPSAEFVFFFSIVLFWLPFPFQLLHSVSWGGGDPKR